jgi:hypothetical protein
MCSVHAAMLRAFRTKDERVLYWDADDFFVPPGLWGMGIGEDFLKRLRGRKPGDGAEQWVAIARPPAAALGAAKSAADRRRMYQAAGFATSPSPPPGIETLPDVDWLMRAVDPVDRPPAEGLRSPLQA